MNRLGFFQALLALPFLPAWLRRPVSGKPKDDLEVWLKSAIEEEHDATYWPPPDAYWDPKDPGYAQAQRWVAYSRGRNGGLTDLFENYLRSVGRGDEAWLVDPEDGKLERRLDIEKVDF